MRNMTGNLLALTLLITLIFAPNSYAASYTTYGSVAGFTAAAGTTLSQNFNSYSDSQWMYGIDFITGVNVTSNESSIRVLGTDKFLFAFDPSNYDPRAYGTAYYQINFSSSYKAAGFDVTSWEIGGGSKALASDPGIVRIFFADGTSASIDLYQTTDMALVFFGVVADTAISYIQWYEPLEGGNNGYTECPWK